MGSGNSGHKIRKQSDDGYRPETIHSLMNGSDSYDMIDTYNNRTRTDEEKQLEQLEGDFEGTTLGLTVDFMLGTFLSLLQTLPACSRSIECSEHVVFCRTCSGCSK